MNFGYPINNQDDQFSMFITPDSERGDYSHEETGAHKSSKIYEFFVPEEYRIEYLVDKTKTYSKGILGLTIECAQCHDHKYDPFKQKDYYSLLAFFNNTKEKGYEGDVSQSKPAKHPLINISDADIKTVLSFINKKDTGNMTV